jgi:hypothetical protein
MAITYNHRVLNISSNPSIDGLTNVITHVQFEYKGINENGTEGIYEQSYYPPLPNSEDFIPLNELTEEVVWNWILQYYPEETLNTIVQNQIKEIENPTVVDVSLPWVI